MNIDQKIKKIVQGLSDKLVARRRDFHRYPEAGWTEFRTASIVIETLTSLGYEVQYGEQVIEEGEMMGVPDAAILKDAMERAVRQGANPAFVAQMAGGKTGVVGTLRFKRPGPTLAFRFDMDCNDVAEATDEKHRPFREGFSSVNPGYMHACGHDGHTSVGLAVAEVIAALQEELSGEVRLIFQPAEEGVRGAKAMAEKGVVKGVDYLVAAHLMMPPVGYLAYDVQGFLATSKFDAMFRGVSAHAGASPETGKNALLAAATAAVHLHGISRHSDGISRINVGVIQAGTGRNVVPANGLIQVETRGATSKVNQYLYENAERMIRHAAAMYDTEVEIIQKGGAVGGNNSPEFSERIGVISRRLGIFDTYGVLKDIGGSEDCSYFMENVQQNGGQASYLIVGASLAAGNHNLYFDFDEQALTLETQLFAAIAVDLLGNQASCR